MSTSWETYLEAHRAQHLEELLAFLRIPSISALPEHAADVRRAADWLAARLSAAGLESVRVLPTDGHPVVYAEWLHAEGQPTVLIYGHLDTQPVDPLDLWERPPFEPTVEAGRIYARGATDDKGNLLAPVLALEALLRATGRLPVNVKCLFEGQEEIGSPHMDDFIAAHRDLLACDLVLSADGGQYSETQPALITGLRGICALQVDVFGPDHDLHSGTYGGAVANPIHALVQLLDSLRTPEGKVAVEGFYEEVAELSTAERAQLAAIPFDEAAYKAAVGVEALHGEPDYTPLERTWVRPTLEVNGIWGGFQGEGSKTVLPSEAHAKITCRLVPFQTPARVLAAIQRHIAAQRLPGVRVQVQVIESGSPAYLIPPDHQGLRAAGEVLTELYGAAPYVMRMGGSIPVCGMFLRHLQAYTVIYSFGLNDERTHSPNEFYRLSSFHRAQSAYGRLLERLAQG